MDHPLCYEVLFKLICDWLTACRVMSLKAPHWTIPPSSCVSGSVRRVARRSLGWRYRAQLHVLFLEETLSTSTAR